MSDQDKKADERLVAWEGVIITAIAALVVVAMVWFVSEAIGQ